MKKKVLGLVFGVVIASSAVACNAPEEEATGSASDALHVLRATGKTTKETGVTSWELRTERGAPTIVGLDASGAARGRISARKTPSGTYVVATTFEGTTTRELSANGELLRESGSSRGEALSAALARDIGAAPAEGPRERELERRPGTASGLAPQGFFEAVGCVGNIIGFATSPGWGTGLRMVASCASTAQDVNDAYAQGIADCLDAGGLYCGLH